MTEPPVPRLDEALIDQYVAEMEPRVASVQSELGTLAGSGSAPVLVAVSKGQPVEAVVAALSLGLTTFGENYAQELLAKTTTLLANHDQVSERVPDAPSWHFIGQLQTNKVRLIADEVDLWQSVDRVKAAREIARRSPGAAILLQVNLSGEDQKAGCSFDMLGELFDSIAELDVSVEGLMGVGSASDPAVTAAEFERLRVECGRRSLPVCSMGMSADLGVACEAGSTMVRLGSRLFGPRIDR